MLPRKRIDTNLPRSRRKSVHPVASAFLCYWLVFFSVLPSSKAQSTSSTPFHKAQAPLYRDPIFDGAADPVVIWNPEEKSWWMLYTQRRANVDAADVAYCYGTAIGVASSHNNGQSWEYRGTLTLDIERGMNTFWAPDIVFHNGQYHLFVVYIPGVRNHWGGKPRMAHYTGQNLWDWQFKNFISLSSDEVIDATLLQLPTGQWRMWYKDQTRGSITMMAESRDLDNWRVSPEPAIGGKAHEGPKAFRFGDWYWMLTDEWAGMRVYRSRDCTTWEKQGMILDKPGSRPEDTPSGAHGDVIVVNDKAFVFYFTHPGRKSHSEAALDQDGVLPYSLRRSSIQVAPLVIQNGTLVSERDQPFDFWLPNRN